MKIVTHITFTLLLLLSLFSLIMVFKSEQTISWIVVLIQNSFLTYLVGANK